MAACVEAAAGQTGRMSGWADFEAAAPELAAFGAARLMIPPAYLATVRSGGAPRVHPVTPIIGGGRLFVFMEPTSPKVRDLRDRRYYALHNSVPDTHGSGGEFYVRGEGAAADDAESRALATASSSYTPADRYVLFELSVSEARGNGYGDVVLPERAHWVAEP